MSDRINDFLDKICASVKYRKIQQRSRSGGEYVAFKIG